jgi:hypothetical protein
MWLRGRSWRPPSAWNGNMVSAVMDVEFGAICSARGETGKTRSEHGMIFPRTADEDRGGEFSLFFL